MTGEERNGREHAGRDDLFRSGDPHYRADYYRDESEKEHQEFKPHGSRPKIKRNASGSPPGREDQAYFYAAAAALLSEKITKNGFLPEILFLEGIL